MMLRGIVILLFSLSAAKASLYGQYALYYSSDSADTETLESSQMRNNIFIGADFGKNKQWVIGQNILIWSKSETNGSGDPFELSIMELGPRFQYFFNQTRTVFVSATYNLYAKGDITSAGETKEVSGSSYFVNLGYLFKASKAFYFGVSLNYHSLSISEKVVGTEKSTGTESYTNIYPAIEVSIRFR